MNNNSYAIVVEEASKVFTPKKAKPVVALDNISLNIPYGSISALVGADGAGKTTLLRMVCGLLTLEQGSISVLGLDVKQHAHSIQSRISYMPQRFGLYEDLTVQENLDLYADLHNVPQDERIQRFSKLLTMTDLARFTGRLAGKLSGGMKQKLGLACTLVRAPELLILDEPSVGVDPLSRLELWEIIEQLVKDEQLTVLLSTTYMDEAQRCARVFILHEGKLLVQDTPTNIAKYANNNSYLITPRADESVRLLQALFYDLAVTVDAVPEAGKVRLVLTQQQDFAQIKPLLGDRAYQAIAPSLEDGFMLLLKQQATDKQSFRYPSITSQKNISQNKEVIKVHNLRRLFGDFVAVDKTSFSIGQGEIFGLLGPNGAGKTTTFRMLCGLLPASEGELEVAGVDLRTAAASARKRIGYVAQKFSLYGHLTVKENLIFFGRAYGLKNKKLQQRISDVCKEFSLEKYFTVSTAQLPGGFKQRLSMATGLLHEPEILFLDEPTSGSDPIARREFWRRITALAIEGTTIIVTTHFMEEAEYCDRILIQDAGKVLAFGTPSEVRAQAKSGGLTPLSMEQAFIEIVQQQRQKVNSHTTKEAGV